LSDAKQPLLEPRFGNPDCPGPLARLNGIAGYAAMSGKSVPGEPDSLAPDKWGKAIGGYEEARLMQCSELRVRTRIVGLFNHHSSKAITGAILDLDTGALRELHWHPTADEWQYVIEGQVSDQQKVSGTNLADTLSRVARGGIMVPDTFSDIRVARGGITVPDTFSDTHEAKIGDFLTYLAVNGYTTVDDRGPRYSYLSLTPGLRFHLANDYYFTTGIKVPLTGPKNQSFTYSPIFWLTKVW
jgi:hypothetical protein